MFRFVIDLPAVSNHPESWLKSMMDVRLRLFECVVERKYDRFVILVFPLNHPESGSRMIGDVNILLLECVL
ncbi:MAG: hypothetical protein LBS54_04430 [Dysgonamonadaceae bacterium]|nr:hypothetical protein [Dysgonamonadaceae bacterium]